MKKLNIFEYAEQHKDCPEHTNEYKINGKKYIVHSHFVGQKDIDKVLSDIAVNRAMSEVLYNNAVDNDINPDLHMVYNFRHKRMKNNEIRQFRYFKSLNLTC